MDKRSYDTIRAQELRLLMECVRWAAQQGYTGAEDAAKGLERITNTTFKETQPYYNMWEFVPNEVKAAS